MQKRHILWWQLCLLLICKTFVTVNINFAIISMVNFHKDGDQTNNSNLIFCPNTTIFLRNSLITDTTKTSIRLTDKGYDWSIKEQNLVLSGFHWLNYFSILPGAVLAQKYGSKIVIGYSLVISSVLSSLIPILTDHGPKVIASVRAVQGLLSYMSAPAATTTIIGRWSPPEERGKFGSSQLVGMCIGQTLGSFCFGFIAEYLHWKYIFHMTSICGIIWGMLWYLLVHDFPKDHPTISSKERRYIETSLKQCENTETKKQPIPWKSIFTSVPTLIGIIATNSLVWSYVMRSTYAPIYLKSMYGLNSDEIGIVISFMQLCSSVLSLLIGYYGDKLIQKKIFSIGTMRKTCTLIGSISAGIPLLIMAFTDCNLNLVLICIIVHTLLKTWSYFGASLSSLDLSPNFCGVIEGLSATFTYVQAFLYTAMISYLSGILKNEDLWKFVFIHTALFLIITNSLYLLFGSSKVQHWNDSSPQKERNQGGKTENIPLEQPQVDIL